MKITPKRNRLIHGDINLKKGEVAEVDAALGKQLVESGAAVEVPAVKKERAP